MTPEQEARLDVHRLVAGLSQSQIADLTLAALRASRKERGSAERCYGMRHAVGRHLLTLLAAHRDWPVPQPRREDLEKVFTSVLLDEQLFPILDALWALVHRGFLFPSVEPPRPGEGGNGDPVAFYATPAGLRLLDATDDHPALPRSIARASERCSGLAEEVVVHLEQAQACLDRGLLRPAAILVGLAYEVAVEKLVESLVARGKLPSTVLEENAAKRLAALKVLVAAQKPRDEWYPVADAIDSAGLIRDRRNDAAHPQPRFRFDDEAEIEELVLSAVRRLPGLWELKTRP